MSESIKPRFAVDLDEIERQLAQAHAAPASRNDPLSELARIVGQDDPFQSILANDPAARPRALDPSSLDDLFVTRDDHGRSDHRQADYGRSDYGQAPAYGLRGSLDHEVQAGAQETAGPASTAGPYHRQDFQASPPREDCDPALYANYYADDRHAEAASSEYPIQAEPEFQPYGRRRSRKGMVAVATIAGLVALGVGGTMMLKGKTTLLASGEPPLIKASVEPTKVQPQSPGGVEIPNQNKQIYERASNDTQTKVVNREEQPVDVRQAIRASGASEATGATSPAPLPIAQQPAAGSLNLGEPRKVRTVSIRPDGTVVGGDTGALPLALAAAPATTSPAAAPAPVMQTPGAGPVAAAPRPAATTPSTTAPRATPPASGGSSPQPAALPAAAAQQTQQPAANLATPQRIAAAQASAVAPAAVPTEAASAGGFSVQLAISTSEAEAKAALQRLQQKYADLGTYAPMIRKAEANGNTIYRVRVGPMARDEASSLCSKIQGQGGQCFVAKN